MGNDIEKKIIKTLSKHPEGITIIDISREIGVHRNTVSKYIFGLVKEGLVTQRRIGVVSLCYLNEGFDQKLKKRVRISKSGMANFSIILIILISTIFYINLILKTPVEVIAASESTSGTINIKNPSGSLVVSNAPMACGATTCSAGNGQVSCTYYYNTCQQVGYYSAAPSFLYSYSGNWCGNTLETTSEAKGYTNIYQCIANGTSGCDGASNKCLDSSSCCPDNKCKGGGIGCCVNGDCSQGYSCNSTKSCVPSGIAPPVWSNNLTQPTTPTEYETSKTYRFNITWTGVTTSIAFVYFQWTNSSGTVNETPSVSGDVYYMTKSNLGKYGYKYKWFAKDIADNWNSTPLLDYNVQASNTTMKIDIYNPSGGVVVNNASMACIFNGIAECGNLAATTGTCGSTADSSANRSTITCTYPFNDSCTSVGNYTAKVYTSHLGFNCYDASIDNTQGGSGHTGCIPGLCALDTCSQNEVIGSTILYQCVANGSTCNNANLKCLTSSACCPDNKCKGDCCSDADCPAGYWCNSYKQCIRTTEPFLCVNDTACTTIYKMNLFSRTPSGRECLVKTCCSDLKDFICPQSVGACYENGTYKGKADTYSQSSLISSSGWADLFTNNETMNPCPAGTVGYGPNVACGFDNYSSDDRMAYWPAVERGTIKNICFRTDLGENINYYIKVTPESNNTYNGTVTFQNGWACDNVNLTWDYSSLALGKSTGKAAYTGVTTGGNSYNGITPEPTVDRWYAVCIQRIITCGNGIVDAGENCLNCPNDAGCLIGNLCCADGACGSSCPTGSCNNNTVCETGENCECSDCYDKQDGCILGDICSFPTELCDCNIDDDGVCTLDPSCKALDPDCNIGPGCDCGNWYDVGCGIAPCTSTQRKETRECDPAGCAAESICNSTATTCLSNFRYSADIKYFNVFWNSYYSPLEANPNRQISEACTFNCDPRSEDCTSAQKCLPYPVTQMPGLGSCSVINPQYKFGLGKDRIVCRVYDPADQSKESWY